MVLFVACGVGWVLGNTNLGLSVEAMTRFKHDAQDKLYVHYIYQKIKHNMGDAVDVFLCTQMVLSHDTAFELA